MKKQIFCKVISYGIYSTVYHQREKLEKRLMAGLIRNPDIYNSASYTASHPGKYRGNTLLEPIGLFCNIY